MAGEGTVQEMTGRAESAGEWGGWRRHVVERTVCFLLLLFLFFHPSDSNLIHSAKGFVQIRLFSGPYIGLHHYAIWQ